MRGCAVKVKGEMVSGLGAKTGSDPIDSSPLTSAGHRDVLSEWWWPWSVETLVCKSTLIYTSAEERKLRESKAG